MRRTVGIVALLVLCGACGGPDTEYLCEQTFECTFEDEGDDDLGDIMGDLIDACEDAFDEQLDMCKDSEVDDIDAAIEDCKDKKGCAFLECLALSATSSAECLTPEQSPSECGDDWADLDEECDGSDLWGEDCDGATGGAMSGGTLSCTSTCTFDTSGCM